MLALRWHGRGDIRLDHVPEPAEVPEGCSLIRVSCCGICGTDLHELRNGPSLIRLTTHPLTGQSPPLTLGHEFSGAIVAGTSLEAGTRVTADACWRCGACEACRRGDYHLCRYGGSIGLHSDGAFAPLVVVPDYTLVPLSDRISDQQGALAEPLAVAVHALKRGNLGFGEHILIIGFGPIGAATALVAKTEAGRVVVVEQNPERQHAAEQLGFEVLEAGKDLPRRLRSLLGSGGADVVIESTGVGAVLQDAIEAAKRGGRIVSLGLGDGSAQIDTGRITLFERTLLGSLGYRHDLPVVVKMMEAGVLDPTPLVSDIVSLDEAATTMRELAANPGSRLKVLVETDTGTSL